MDDDLTLQALEQREAERKLAALPAELLESAWAGEAQIEAVIDGVLTLSYASYPSALAHVRHVGEWSARIAAALPYGPDPSFARRAGVLCEMEPRALARVPELARFADAIEEYQSLAFTEVKEPTTVALVVAVADEFDHRVAAYAQRRGASPSSILAAMLSNADSVCRPVVEALAIASRGSNGPVQLSHRR